MDSNPVSFATKASDSGEKLSTGVTQAQLIFRNSISLSKQILRSKRVLHIQDTTRSTDQIALSDRMDELISKQNTLIKVASKKQSKTDHHALVEYDPAVTEYPINSYLLFISPLAIAQQNEQEFVVELESHTIVGSHIALLHVDKLHDYLRANAMKTLIPSEHK